MNALIKGKHYNQAWLIHETFSEAIIRIFIEKHHPVYLDKMDFDNIEDFLMDEKVKEYLNQFDEKFENGLQGEYGATARYWMTYAYLVDILQTIHQSIQLNDFDERLKALYIL